MASSDESSDYEVFDGIKLLRIANDIPNIKDEDSEKLKTKLSLGFSNSFTKWLEFVMLADEFVHCSQDLKIPKWLFLNDKRQLVLENEMVDVVKLPFANFSTKSFEDALNKLNIDKYTTEPKDENEKLSIQKNQVRKKSFLSDLDSNKISLESVKLEFDICTHFQYYIGLSTINLYGDGHKNLLIFNKNEKVVTWIDPQYEESKYQKEDKEFIVNAIIKILDFLITDKKERKEWQIDTPSKICPQAITLDNNCIFWSILLGHTMIVNPNATIDEVSAAFLKKYNTKESLSNYIEKYKYILFQVVINKVRRSGGKRRKTSKSKLKKRKTRRNIKPRKQV